MARTIPFDCKYIWGSRELDNELNKISNRIRKERQINIGSTILTHQLALDIQQGRITFEPETIRFRQKNQVKFNNGTKARL